MDREASTIVDAEALAEDYYCVGKHSEATTIGTRPPDKVVLHPRRTGLSVVELTKPEGFARFMVNIANS